MAHARSFARDYCERGMASTRAAGSSRPFEMPGDKPHYSRDRLFTLHHLKIEVAIDFSAKMVRGTSSLVISPTAEQLSVIEFDAVNLAIKGARLESGEALAFEVGKETVRVSMPRPLNPGERSTIAIEYEALPRKGLYFVGPDAAYPNKPVQAWTQGQDQDTRYWAPCYDFPNQRATTEIIATVPEDMFALSNGVLAQTTHDSAARTRTYHWRQDEPHVTYLVTLVVGRYAEVADSFDGVPLLFYVPHGREDDGRRSLGNTADMMRVFTELLGAPYPWAKYAQITVADFIFGGMENTSATTLTETTLHDARAHVDFSSDPLVAHELAHQWFGDWLTCKDWSHAWLNEGFATYFEALYTERHLGADEFNYEMFRNARLYLAEASDHYRRPIVTRTYGEPIDIFDRHLYEKGSLVLHMLRHSLGDELFFKSIRSYVQKHRNSVVDTESLRQAIEETTGRTMEAFFEQWVYKAGHPELKVSYTWDADDKLARVTITQEQDEKENSIFKLAVSIDFLVGGAFKTYRLDLTEKEHRFHFPLDDRPSMVRFDPGDTILKSLEEDMPRDLHLERLRRDEHAVGRIRAAQALGKLGTIEAVQGLKAAVQSDPFWGVQAEAAAALGGMKTPGAQAALLECTAIRHPKGRRAVVAALGEFKNDAVADALADVLARGDESYFVEAEAARSLGKTRSGRAFEPLVRALDKESHQDVIRSAVMDGLAELRDERGLAIAREWARYGKPQPVRSAAIWAAYKLGEDRKDTVSFLEDFLSDPWLRVRLRTIDALESLGDSRGIGPLSAMIDREVDGRVKRRAREAIANIREGTKGKEELRKLRDDIGKLQEDNKTLLERVDKLEARLK